MTRRGLESHRVACVLLGVLMPALALADAPPRVAGWLETLTFPDNGLAVTAKLDTGAKTSAIDAEEVEDFEKDGETWVRFAVRQKKNATERRWFEARVAGEKRIRTSFGRETRRTVSLWVCLGGDRRRVLFTLGSRDHMNYRVILGRRALEGRLLVDSGDKFVLEAGCPVEAARAAEPSPADNVDPGRMPAGAK